VYKVGALLGLYGLVITYVYEALDDPIKGVVIIIEENDILDLNLFYEDIGVGLGMC